MPARTPRLLRSRALGKGIGESVLLASTSLRVLPCPPHLTRGYHHHSIIDVNCWDECRGKEGVSELEDYAFNTTKTRRRTNSSTAAAGHSMLKTKFEAIDPEVIEYEEDVHGPGMAGTVDAAAGAEDAGGELEKMSTGSSADTMGSVDEEEMMVEKK